MAKTKAKTKKLGSNSNRTVAIKPTALNQLIPMVPAVDVDKTIKFYVDYLGFKLVHKIEIQGKTGWAHISHGDVHLMINCAESDFRPALDSTIYYYYPQDVVALHRSIQQKEHPVSDLAVTFYAMKEFKMIDPEGRFLCFGQDCSEPETDNNEATERWVRDQQKKLARKTGSLK